MRLPDRVPARRPARRWGDGAVAVYCGLAALVTALAVQLASRLPRFEPSMLLTVTPRDPLARLILRDDPTFVLSSVPEHYDGVYLWAMARDPLARGQAHDLIDLASYRYGHPFYAWLARLLSFGRPDLLDVVFWLLSLASMAAAGYLVSRLASRLGASPWWGLLVALSPGLLFSASTALTEPFQVALVAAMLLAWYRRAPAWTLALLGVALCLTKEQLALVPVALGLALLGEMTRRRVLLWGQATALALGPVVLLAWRAYVRTRFTAAQQHYDEDNVGLPFLGWAGMFESASRLRDDPDFASQVGTTAPAGLVAIAGLLVTAVLVALHRRDALAWVVVLQAALVSTLGWRTLLYPHEMYRIPSVALLFAGLLLAVALAPRDRAFRPAAPTPPS